MLHPIAEAINAMEMTGATVAMAVGMWIDLIKKLEKTPAATLVTNRAEQLLKYPPALLAYALHPSLSALSPLPPMRLMVARQFLVEKGSEQIVSQFDM